MKKLINATDDVAGEAATADLRARLGRAGYLGDRAPGHPDPGAQAVALWRSELAGPAQP